MDFKRDKMKWGAVGRRSGWWVENDVCLERERERKLY